MDVKTAYQADAPRAQDAKRRIVTELRHQVGVSQDDATERDWLVACSLAVRSMLVERWHASNERSRDKKQVGYLSMEFLLSRQLINALLALDLKDEFADALAELGVRLDDIVDLEPEPALGNGGLGRLAACFLDSTANIGVPAYGYGIYFEYGMFRQTFSNGWQIEQPEEWLVGVNPWDFSRSEPSFQIGFGGHVEHRDHRAIWTPQENIIAVAHDLLVPAQDGEMVNTLRLWSARPMHGFDIATFNRGRHIEALAPKIRSKTLSRLLYPDDSTDEGRELRLRQEYFFVAASVQDMLARFTKQFGSQWDLLPDRIAIHLNDTHPALAPIELMRLLIDVHGLGWDRAWGLTSNIISYTNHTLMPEALETWRLDLMARVIPRHLQIIEEINRRIFDSEKLQAAHIAADRLSLVSSDQSPVINMGRLSAYASHRVNGVSALHSALVKEKLFPELATLHPDRFTNVTNGISQRLWLFQSNPELTSLLDETIGREWRRGFHPAAFSDFSEDQKVISAISEIKARNKRRAAQRIASIARIDVDPSAMFDVQIKRIHEYKRQLLNIFGIISRWFDLKDGHRTAAPKVALMAGKAASSYWLAKLIIKLANDVAAKINSDPDTRDHLKFLFLPNYNVSMAEWLIPAADLSQQISLAGTEASGTGNMKLAMNGALTLGTRDGANIEIADAVGADNIFMFGLTVDEVVELRPRYSPHAVSQADPKLKRILESIGSGEFSPDDPHRFRPLLDMLLGHGDRYMVIADFADYLRGHADVDRLWADRSGWNRKVISNIAGMGTFSSDRSVGEYARNIWQTPTAS
jgi:glycogen phosphorylase